MAFGFPTRNDQPLSIILRDERPAKSSLNAPVEQPPAPPRLHRRSTAREIAQAAVFVRPGEFRYKVPEGWTGDITRVHELLNERTMEMMLTDSFPAPAKKQPALTQAERDAKRVEEIRTTSLTRREYDNRMTNEGFATHQWPAWTPPTEEVRQSRIAQWIQKQMDALGSFRFRRTA